MAAQVSLKLRMNTEERELTHVPVNYQELLQAVSQNFRLYNYKVSHRQTPISNDRDLVKAYLNSREDVFFIDVQEENPQMEHMDESVQNLYDEMLNRFKSVSTQDNPGASGADIIQVNERGIVGKTDLLRLIRELADTAKVRLTESSDKFLAKRQEFYGIDEENWKKVAMEQLQFQEMLLNTVTHDVVSRHGITLQQFEMSNMMQAQDPQVREALQEMAMTTLSGQGDVPDSLTKEKLREVLEYTCNFIETYIRDNQSTLTPADIVLLKVREGDEVMKQFGYNENEIAAALTRYNIDSDPYWNDIRQRLDQVMASAFGVPAGMMGMGGPMGMPQ